MKDGERLVWAAAFAAEMNKIDPSCLTEAETQRIMADAATKAHGCVLALRLLAECPPVENFPALDMLRDMAGVRN